MMIIFNPDAAISCESSMNSYLGTSQSPHGMSITNAGNLNPSVISSITPNTHQNNNMIPNVRIPLTMIPFSKKNTKVQANKYVDTVFANIIAPSLSSISQHDLKIEHLTMKMSEMRDDVIQTGKSIFALDVQNRLLNLHLITKQDDARLDSIIRHGNSRNIFKYFSDKYGTPDDYIHFVTMTSPIFLSPVILHKGWINNLKTNIENKYRFIIARMDNYDTPRCENFVRMIAHKNIKDTVEKWYNNFLIKYGCKLLTKMPKGDKTIIATIVINHPIVDKTFQPSYIYIVKTKITFGESINTLNHVSNTVDEKDEDDLEREQQEQTADFIVDEYCKSYHVVIVSLL